MVSRSPGRGAVDTYVLSASMLFISRLAFFLCYVGVLLAFLKDSGFAVRLTLSGSLFFYL
jgi:hypothetical protein